MMGNNQDNNSLEVNTDGGAYVGKGVATEGGDFIGRDVNIYNYNSSSTTQVEERTKSDKSAESESKLYNWWKISETIVAALITAAATIGAVILSYWFFGPTTQVPAAAPTQLPAIAQQVTPTATQGSPATTETPAPLLTSLPLASTEAQLISDTLAIPASPTPTETTTPTATHIPLSPSGYPCEAQIIVPVGVNRVTLLYASKDGNIKQGGWVTEGAKVKITSGYAGAEIRYQIETIEGIELGWISKRFLSLSPSCPQILS